MKIVRAVSWISLLHQRDDVREHTRGLRKAKVAKRLLELKEPMTRTNAIKWWKVAKPFLDEQWHTNPKLFEPLLAATKERGVPLNTNRHRLYPSEVRSRVIDLHIKKPFLKLARDL